MKIDDAGIQFIKEREGEELTAYRDSAGVWTIGVGHTRGVKKGDKIDQNKSTLLLLQDLAEAENAINHLVTVPLTQSQFNALVSFTFNLGSESLQKSTLLKLLNKKQYISAASEFEKWNKEHVDGKLVSSKGLSIRRDLERTLFLSE
jgi:lysozyme